MPVLAMPKLGLTMEEGRVAEWKVAPGDAFAAGDILVVIETDKIASEVESNEAGVIVALDAAVDDVVPVGGPLARWQAPGGPAIEAASVAETPAPVAAPAAVEPKPAAPARTVRSKGRILATPLARRQAARLSVDLGVVTGSGPRGRIKSQDVVAAAEAHKQAAAPKSAAPAVATATAIKPGAWQAVAAERMVLSKTTIPHFYLSAHVDAAPADAAIAALREAAPGRKITATHLILLAMGRALRAMPEANRVWEGGQLIVREDAAVGLAVATPHGLAAPVVPGCDGDVWSVAAAAQDLVSRARTAELSAADMQRLTATTLSNAGMFDIAQMISIIPPGQSSILGVGSTQSVFRPDDAGAPKLHREFTLSLSCDHRVFDGEAGIRFLNLIRVTLSNPLKALLAPV